MAKEVSWSLELAIQPAHQHDLQALVQEMVEATQQGEPGALDYQWSTNADGTVCHIYERYADSEAAMAHLANFGEKFAERFLTVLAPTRFVVYGNPSQEVQEALAPFSPTYMGSVGGFSR